MNLFGKNVFIIALTGIACLFAACGPSPKEEAVNRLRELCNDAKANSKYYTDEQWLSFLDEYQEVDSLLSKFVFDDHELAEISPMKGRCAAYAMKAKSVKESLRLDNALHDSRGVFKGYDSGK